MLYEFAIEPSLLNCWARYDYFMADCGFDTGRLVSEFPNFHWKDRVWAAVENNPARTAMDEQKVQYHLQHTADAKLVYNGRRYNFEATAPPWLDQALREHKAKPFRAIVASSKVEGDNDVLYAEEFDKDKATSWHVEPSVPIARTPEEIASITRLLCRGTRLVKLLDPHLKPGEPRFKKSFRSLFETICQIGATGLRLEVHCGVDLEWDDFARTIAAEWPELIPPRRKVHFFRWKEQSGGEQLHRRTILADRGGILVEAGLDCGREGQTTTVSRLSAAEHLRFWNGLQAPTSANPSPDCLYELDNTCEAMGSIANVPKRP
jgi:hypothetical protein